MDVVPVRGMPRTRTRIGFVRVRMSASMRRGAAMVDVLMLDLETWRIGIGAVVI